MAIARTRQPCCDLRAYARRSGYTGAMKPVVLSRAEVQQRIQSVASDVVRLGVRRLALFGSVSRDAAGPDSDVDLLVEFAPEHKTLAHLVDLGDLLEAALGRRVELVTPEGLSPFMRPRILADAVDVVRAA